VRYFCSRWSLSASLSCFMRLRGRCSSRTESIQSSALLSMELDESWIFCRAEIRLSAIVKVCSKTVLKVGSWCFEALAFVDVKVMKIREVTSVNFTPPSVFQQFQTIQLGIMNLFELLNH
jgi:hypothetical protein